MNQRPRQRHRTRYVVAGALALVGIISVWHYWTLYTALSGARTELLATQTTMDAGLDVQSADLAQARVHLKVAGDDVHRARRHLDFDPLFQVARFTPGVSGQAQAADDFVEMAGRLIEIGTLATSAGDKTLALRDSPHDGQPLTAALVQLLADIEPELERMDTLSREAVKLRMDIGDRSLVGPLDSMRTRIDADLPKLANAVSDAKQVRGLLPALLGFDGERRYMIYALNNAELAPGGGFLTTAGVMPVASGVPGQVDFSDTTTWKGQWEALGGGYITPPGPLRRYLLKDFGWNLSTSNWDPDFTVWARQSLQFYELVHGPQQVDGIVAVDLVVLERLLRITGPKTLPVEGHGDVTFDASNAILTLEILTRQASDPTSDRKSVVGDLAERVIADLLKLPSDKWAEAAKTIRALGNERHVQVLSFKPEEQSIIRDIGWDGRLAPIDGDYVMLNEASVNSTKLNLIIKPTGTYRIELGTNGEARHDLTINYTNNLPEWAKGKDPKVVSQLVLGGLYGGYFRVIAPPSLRNPQAQVDGKPVGIEDSGTAGDRRWFGAFMALPSGQRSAVGMTWAVPRVATDHEYSLYLQKQPGTDGLCLDLSITHEGAPAKLDVEGGQRDPSGRICLTSDVKVSARF